MSRDVKDTALKYLSMRERSTEEVKKHLRDKCFEESEINTTVEYLSSFNYLNDERFCEAYVRYGLSKKKGTFRIRQELLERGVAGETVQRVLGENVTSEMERENAWAETKKIINRSDREMDEKLKAKIGRRLVSLGYKSNMIYDILNQISKVSDENE